MRETFTATVRWLEKKTLYKSVGLPYRSVALIDVQKDGQPVENLQLTTCIPYSQTLHDLDLKSGDKLQFTATLDQRAIDIKMTTVFKYPRNYVKVQNAK